MIFYYSKLHIEICFNIRQHKKLNYKEQRLPMENMNGEQLGKKIINYQKLQNAPLIRKRNNELFSLTFVIILLVAILWFFVSSIFINILCTAILLLFYFVLFADIVDYNRALRNVKREVSEFLKKNKGMES